jgi:hypothetical protein
MHHSIISGDLLFKKGCALFHTTKCFKGDQDCVLQSGTTVPWPWAQFGADAKATGKISTCCTNNAGRQNQWDFGYSTTVSCQKDQIMVCAAEGC